MCIRDRSRQTAKLTDALANAKAGLEGKTITVEDDGELARWLFTEGFPVTTVKLNPHQGVTKEQRRWLDEHGVKVENPMRGGKGGPGGRPGGPGGRGGKPGGKPGGRPEALKLGYAGAMDALNTLKRSAGGEAR